MNCKQGDLARIVPDLPSDEWARGLIVECWVLGTWKGLPAWKVEPALRTPNGQRVEMVSDCILRPIRDPGEDARDETLDWLPAPRREQEVA